MADSDEITEAVKQAATEPKAASGDSGSVTQRDIREQVEAAKFIGGEKVKSDPFKALRYMKYGSH